MAANFTTHQGITPARKRKKRKKWTCWCGKHLEDQQQKSKKEKL